MECSCCRWLPNICVCTHPPIHPSTHTYRLMDARKVFVADIEVSMFGQWKNMFLARTEAVSATIRVGFRGAGAGRNSGADFYRIGETRTWFSFTAPGMPLAWSRIVACWLHFVGSKLKANFEECLCCGFFRLGWAARSASKNYMISQNILDFGMISLWSLYSNPAVPKPSANFVATLNV